MTLTSPRRTRSSSGDASDRLVTRRELLAAVGGAAAVSRVGADERAADAAGVGESGDPRVRVRVYPGPVPLRAQLRYGLEGLQREWLPPFRAAATAVEDAFDQVLAYARERSRLPGLEVRVDRGDPVALPLTAASRPSDVVVPSLETVTETVRERLRERNALTGSTCHLLLCWAPLNYRVGYGGTLSPNARTEVGSDDADGDDTGDAITVANVGATEVWDSRAVTRNIAIHEALHTFLDDAAVASAVDSRCDHDLGTAVRTDDDALRISPMATAYAGPDEIGGGTRFHGTGCYDHGQFSRHDGLEGIDEWRYTAELSDATLEAVTQYLERRFDP